MTWKTQILFVALCLLVAARLEAAEKKPHTHVNPLHRLTDRLRPSSDPAHRKKVPVREDDNQRAGFPNCISKHARPSNTCAYRGYYVGGSSPSQKHGDARYRNEGTWGWDYVGGRLFKRRVNLLWWHGRDHRKKFGSYKTDGPKLIKHE